MATDKTKPKPKARTGRPSKYTKALGARICKRISDGESLRKICESKTMPNKSTVLLWIVDGEHKEFSDQYRVAREAAGYSHADRMLDLADRLDPDNWQEGMTPLPAQNAKVMIDALKWSAERMAPKAHATRQEIDHTSSDGSMTPKVTATDPVEASRQYQDLMGD